MKKKIIPFAVLALSMGTGACACHQNNGGSSALSEEYVDLAAADYDGAYSLLRADLKGVASSDQQGFNFTPAATQGRGDTDFGIGLYYYPDASASSSSSSSASTEPSLYGFDATLDGFSFRANGLDALSAKDLTTSSVVTNMDIYPLAGMTELSELSLVNQSPKMYTVNDDTAYREYFDLTRSLTTKKAIEAFVTKNYGVAAWTMNAKSYRDLSTEEKTLADGYFTGEKGPTDRLCSDVDANIDWMVKARADAIGSNKKSPVTIAKNDYGSYRLTFAPTTTQEVARFLQGRVNASSIAAPAKIVINNDISHYFEAVSTSNFQFIYYYTAADFTKLALNVNCVADQSKLKASESISYANTLSTSSAKLPDIRLYSFHAIGDITLSKGEDAKVELPTDLSTYQEIVLPEKQTGSTGA